MGRAFRRFKPPKDGPKVLIFDIETSPILAHVWGLWENNVSLNQIHTDWHIISWAAKWLGAPDNEIMYQDQRNASKVSDDCILLRRIWDLLDEADIVITHNGKKFDSKRLNARFIINKYKPTSSYRHIDTLEIAKKQFGFTSNKLEYIADKLNVKYKKMTKRKYDGFSLWVETCVNNNKDAWRELERYNKLDVLTLEEVYRKIIPYDNRINFDLYSDDEDFRCKCGSKDFSANGKYYTTIRSVQRYRCKSCGAEYQQVKDRYKPTSR